MVHSVFLVHEAEWDRCEDEAKEYSGCIGKDVALAKNYIHLVDYFDAI
jgi:hypothetical protein